MRIANGRTANEIIRRVDQPTERIARKETEKESEETRKECRIYGERLVRERRSLIIRWLLQ